MPSSTSSNNSAAAARMVVTSVMKLLSAGRQIESEPRDRKSTRLNSRHDQISYAVFCLKKKKVRPHSPARRPVWTHRQRAAFDLFRATAEAASVPPVRQRTAGPKSRAFFFKRSGDHRDLHSFPTRTLF